MKEILLDSVQVGWIHPIHIVDGDRILQPKKAINVTWAWHDIVRKNAACSRSV